MKKEMNNEVKLELLERGKDVLISENELRKMWGIDEKEKNSELWKKRDDFKNSSLIKRIFTCIPEYTKMTDKFYEWAEDNDFYPAIYSPFSEDYFVYKP